MADKTVQCVVTSPPYYGLREFGTEHWQGGDPECKHAKGKMLADNRQICSKCGAVRIGNHLGLEQTPDEYVANLTAVFREIRRMLRDDGTVWLNLGDSYVNTAILREQGLKPRDLIGIPWRIAFALQGFAVVSID